MKGYLFAFILLAGHSVIQGHPATRILRSPVTLTRRIIRHFAPSRHGSMEVRLDTSEGGYTGSPQNLTRSREGFSSNYVNISYKDLENDFRAMHEKKMLKALKSESAVSSSKETQAQVASILETLEDVNNRIKHLRTSGVALSPIIADIEKQVEATGQVLESLNSDEREDWEKLENALKEAHQVQTELSVYQKSVGRRIKRSERKLAEADTTLSALSMTEGRSKRDESPVRTWTQRLVRRLRTPRFLRGPSQGRNRPTATNAMMRPQSDSSKEEVKRVHVDEYLPFPTLKESQECESRRRRMRRRRNLPSHVGKQAREKKKQVRKSHVHRRAYLSRQQRTSRN